ncbi:unnamed protein product, partial [Vitis vinifera]|uniref:Uncharacterized protein n=1 Tax=Vitis vinifera TaxID=29760 RepID=D7U7Z1_VITVI
MRPTELPLLLSLLFSLPLCGDIFLNSFQVTIFLRIFFVKKKKKKKGLRCQIPPCENEEAKTANRRKGISPAQNTLD